MFIIQIGKREKMEGGSSLCNPTEDLPENIKIESNNELCSIAVLPNLCPSFI
jgi:hypothetical protein